MSDSSSESDSRNNIQYTENIKKIKKNKESNESKGKLLNKKREGKNEPKYPEEKKD